MNERVNKGVRILVYLVLSSAISIVVRVLSSYLRGEHGAPSFVTTGFSIYGFCVGILMVIAYLIFARQIPVKNKVLRGLVFIGFFLVSDYLPQILGMSGGHSEILDSNAMSTTTIINDSIGYIFKGILLGLLVTFDDCGEKRECDRKRMISSAVLSMLTFPAVMGVLEILWGCINKDFLCINAFAINKEETVKFYLIFYLFQAVSGFFFPIIYRYTEFNSVHKKKWLRFASIYGWMLWTPIVVIVCFFGVPLPATIAFSILMLISIYVDTYIYSRILK